MPGTSMLRTVPIAVVLLLGAVGPLSAQTREFLDAPVVKSQIRVSWNTQTKKLEYAVDDDAVFRELTPDKLFVTRTSIFVTYPKINPLRIQATASRTAVDDPAQATIAKLIEAIVKVATIVQPAAARDLRGQGATGGKERIPGVRVEGQPCAALTTAHRRVSALVTALYGPDTKPVAIRQTVSDWIQAVDDAYQGPTPDGPAAVEAGVQGIKAFLATLGTEIEDARTQFAQIETEARAKPAASDACAVAAHTAYNLAVLANPRERIEQLSELRATAQSLRERLMKDYVDHRSRWIDGTNYKIGPEIMPTAAMMQNVVVRVVNRAFSVSSLGTLAVTEEPSDPAALTVRRYSPITPEVGVAAVFGFLKAPRYGTTEDAGRTVVARVPDARVAVTPAVTVNFVCRCQSGPFVAPMLQIGVSTSTEAPAILFGAGIRLFGSGKGYMAIAGGAMVGWVKDLQTLQEGSVVGGTKDIEADLRYRRQRPTGYFVIQYTF